ncbi:MAG: type I-C CRISPR-associated endonuclease Cas1c [Bacteroidales bacterium]|nr:type I-C CRISPR-associated endonuclease Cas1c [Bacteroidales bacterium]
MKKLLNTLYVTKPEAYLSKDGTNVVVSEKGQEIFRIPSQNIESICTFGYQGASPGLMRLCAENGISLSFFSPHGKFIARIQGPVKGNVLLRHKQHELINDKLLAAHLASLSIFAKIQNSRNILHRFTRDYPDNTGVMEVSKAIDNLYKYRNIVYNETLEESIRGIEGYAASVYFSVFSHLILNKEKCFKFSGRHKRPPTDAVNAMLSFGYSLLASECVSALESVGLDPAIGYMHKIRPGRYSLALDLMEELRAYIVDRHVLSLINKRQISPSDFQIHEDNQTTSVRFTDKGLKTFLSSWQSKKRTEIIHPFLQEKIQLGLLPYVQALLLSRYLRNDLDDYPVFLLK